MLVAVVGAGLAGLTAARALVAGGHDVVVFEKSRGAGGRTSTRRGPGDLRFDHGAPFLHDGARPLEGFAAHTWSGPDGARHLEAVGEGANNAPAKALAAGLDVRSAVRVAGVGADGALLDAEGAPLGTFDAVLVTAPAPQAAELLATAAPRLAAVAAGVAYDPCWTVMAAWAAPLGLPFTAAHGAGGLEWAVAEAPKPGRAPGERWVLQADAALTAAQLEDEPEAVATLLLERFAHVAGRELADPAHLAAHRWRFSRPTKGLGALVLREGRLLVAGDWCAGTDAGAAIRSGAAAAAALLA